jgi:hypothetical protein
MPQPEQSTMQALERLAGAKSHRAKCVALGLPLSWRGTVGRILASQAVSLDKENEVRQRLGLHPVMLPLVPVPPCPDCGGVHTGRCNGHPVTAVVTLAPGQAVTTKRPRHYTRIDQMPVAMLAQAIKKSYPI